MKLAWKGLRCEMLCTKQITKYVGKSKSTLPCFIPMKVIPIVVCECTVCYYVTLATMWPVCSLLQTKHPYQHQLNTGHHTEKMDKGRSAIWSSHFLGKKILHPWESTVRCKSLWRSRVLLLQDDTWSHSVHTTVNLLNTWHWAILHHRWHRQTSAFSPKWRSTFKFYSSKLTTSKQRLSNGWDCRAYDFTTNALTFWSTNM